MAHWRLAYGAPLVALTAWMTLLLCGGAHAAGLAIDVQPAKNNRPALFMAPRDTTVGTLFVRFHVGAFDDDQDYGRTRLTQRALIDANTVLGARFLEDVYTAHATLELRTGVRDCAFVLTAPKASLNKLGVRLLEGVFSPRLNDKAIDRAKRLTLDDQQLQVGANHLVQLTAGEVMLSEVSKNGGDYRNPILGDRESVVSLTRKDLTKHAATFFTAANASIAAVGPVDRKLTAALKRLRGGSRHEIKRGDISSLPRKLERRSTREMHLHAQIMDLKSAKDVAVARVLQALVYDRVMWRLRDKGVTYGPYVQAHPFDWLDLLVIFIPVSNSRKRGVRVEPLLRQFLDEILTQVKDEDFMAGRDYVVSDMLQVDHRPIELAEAIMRRNRRVPWHDDEVLKAARALNKEEFLHTIRQWLGPQRSINILFGRGRAQYEKRRP